MKPILDLAQQKQVCEIVAIGGSLKMAAALVGCTPRAIHNTAHSDREFRRRLEAAKLDVTLVSMKTMIEAARDPKHWRAAVCLIELLEPTKELLISYCQAARADRAPVRQPQRATRRHFHTRMTSFMSKKPQKSSGDF